MTDPNTFEPVIGLEIHAQLATRSKMFCGCSANYSGAPPNTSVCAVCAGMPGALPVVNSMAVDMGLRTALALQCTVPEISQFDRKNYSYPDLPKGYQISQYAKPIGEHGVLLYEAGGEQSQTGIIRVHLEEDTGKSTHTAIAGREVTLVDYNRSGVPLMEIVSEPDMRSPAQARAYFAALRQTLMYLGVNDGNLQEGSLRADVNISLRTAGGLAGTKVEIKNLNSFRAVQRSLAYEIDRQQGVLSAGGELVQETRGWSEMEGVTFSQRSKEYAHDYRYFPEPDLPPLRIRAERLVELESTLPELPALRKARFVSEFGLPEGPAGVLTEERALADYFEAAAARKEIETTALANWITGDLLRLAHETGRGPESWRVPPDQIATLVTMVSRKTVSGAGAKRALEEMFESGERAEAVIERLNLAQIGDRAETQGLVTDVIQTNPKLVETYRNGKLTAIEALVGKVMAASHGKANPAMARELLQEALK
ncbi:MAG: Asp-tRNA(Asn)/Glu-tRNA(Gln) amidotransferase subunit GatB [Chloroflexota bacterium]